MVLPAELLENLPLHLKKPGLLRLASHSTQGSGALSSEDSSSQLGDDPRATALRHLIQKGELPTGGVSELCSEGGSALTTTIALRACRHLQRQSQHSYGESTWCAFLDPSRSLYAPGVQAINVDLKRLLVVRPKEEALYRAALRLVESQVFPLVVIDTAGFWSPPMQGSLAPWVRVLRRLSTFLSGRSQSVLLLTQKSAPRPLPLPVCQRIEITRCTERELSLKVPKGIHGIYSGPLKIPLEQKPERQAS